MTTPTFSPRLKVMSRIERWGIMPMLSPDRLASHSWFVTVYAHAVAELVKYEGNRTTLLLCALLHDVDELCTGEIVSPVKNALMDQSKRREFVEKQLAKDLPGMADWVMGPVMTDPQGEAILRVADRLDAVFTCAMESAFGNMAMKHRFPPCVEWLRERWDKLEAPLGETTQSLWDKHIAPSLAAHLDGANYSFRT